MGKLFMGHLCTTTGTSTIAFVPHLQHSTNNPTHHHRVQQIHRKPQTNILAIQNISDLLSSVTQCNTSVLILINSLEKIIPNKKN